MPLQSDKNQSIGCTTTASVFHTGAPVLRRGGTWISWMRYIWHLDNCPVRCCERQGIHLVIRPYRSWPLTIGFIETASIWPETQGGFSGRPGEFTKGMQLLHIDPRNGIPRGDCRAVVRSDTADKKITAARKKAEPILAKFALAQRAEQSSPKDRVCIEIRTNHLKLVSGMLIDLVHHKLPGYYFLDCVDVNGDDRGYVVLVREIQTIPRELTRLILERIDAHGFASACEKCPEYIGRIQFGNHRGDASFSNIEVAKCRTSAADFRDAI